MSITTAQIDRQQTIAQAAIFLFTQCFSPLNTTLRLTALNILESGFKKTLSCLIISETTLPVLCKVPKTTETLICESRYE